MKKVKNRSLVRGLPVPVTVEEIRHWERNPNIRIPARRALQAMAQLFHAHQEQLKQSVEGAACLADKRYRDAQEATAEAIAKWLERLTSWAPGFAEKIRNGDWIDVHDPSLDPPDHDTTTGALNSPGTGTEP